MAYKYDIFVSYKSESRKWVENAFLPLFRIHLQDALGGKKTSVFMDTNQIENGEAWPNSLKSALAHSRCMVAVLTPGYFHSRWCATEMAVMLHRAHHRQYLSLEYPGGLVAALCVADGKFFPDAVRKIQQEKLHDFYIFAEAFPKTNSYMDFEKALKKWVPEVAKMVNHAPEWQKEWLSEQWLDVPYEHLMIQQPPSTPLLTL